MTRAGRRKKPSGHESCPRHWRVGSRPPCLTPAAPLARRSSRARRACRLTVYSHIRGGEVGADRSSGRDVWAVFAPFLLIYLINSSNRASIASMSFHAKGDMTSCLRHQSKYDHRWDRRDRVDLLAGISLSSPKHRLGAAPPGAIGSVFILNFG